MAVIDLRYGRKSLNLEYDAERFGIIESTGTSTSLTDAQIGHRMDRPISSPSLEEIISPGESVLIVVPDATRQTGSGQIVNLLVRRLIANGTAPYEIAIIFATGIHRKVTADEKAAILTPFILQRIKTLDHDPRDLLQIVRLGETSGGIAVELNRAVVEYDHVIAAGGVTFHYFAGFTGGRKLICPGLASARTISATHKLAFDSETLSRRVGVDTATLDGNAVHEAFVEAAAFAPPSFAINTITDDDGTIVELFCGDWQASHHTACNAYAKQNTIPINEKRDIVIVSCGGHPYDINLIQAHKALEAASHACRDGGTIVLLSECSDGLGREDFINWFEAENSDALAKKLCEKYQVNGQTAWSLLRKAERFGVRVFTALDIAVVEKMRLKKIDTDELTSLLQNKNARGYIIPTGAKIRIQIPFEGLPY
jgi:nickel-dependent lactate racemase